MKATKENRFSGKNMPDKIDGTTSKKIKGEKPEKVEMTEEEKAAKIEELKTNLAAKLEAGEITQEEYDDAIAKIKEGNFMFGGKGGRGMKGERNKFSKIKIETDSEEMK